MPYRLRFLLFFAALVSTIRPLSAQFSSSAYNVGSAAKYLIVSNFDGDAAPDVAVTTSTGVAVFHGLTAGALNAATRINTTWVNGNATTTPTPTCAAVRNLAIASSNLDWRAGASSTYSPTLVGAVDSSPSGDTHGFTVKILGVNSFPSGAPAGTARCVPVAYRDPANTVSWSATFQWLATGDFRGVGHSQIVAVAQNDPNLYVVDLPDPPGSPFTGFAFTVKIPAGANLDKVFTGDLNHDQRPDIVATSGAQIFVFLAQTPVSSNLQDYLSSAPVFTGSAGAFINRVQIVDATGDGKADIVATTANAVVILPGNGNGGFGASTSLPMPAGYAANSAAVGDFNGDGYPDVAVAGAGASSKSSIAIFYGTGAGFGPAQLVTVGSDPAADREPQDIVAYDMDQDGRMDLVVSTLVDGNVWVMLNTKPRLVTTDARNLQMLATMSTSFNGYGAVTIGTSDNTTPPVLTVSRAPNTPDLSSWVGLAVSGNQVTISPNIALAPKAGVYNGVAMVSGLGGGYMKAYIPYSITLVRPSYGLFAGGTYVGQPGNITGVSGYMNMSYPFNMAFGDFDGDGVMEYATRASQFYFSAYWLQTVQSISSYTWPAQSDQTFGGDYALDAASADLDRDGKLDVVTLATNGNVWTYLGLGRAYPGAPIKFAPAVGNYLATPYAHILAVSDVNGDGYADIVTIAKDFPHDGTYGSGALGVSLNDGAGGFPRSYALPSDPGKTNYQNLAVADFNGDGIPDILTRRQKDYDPWDEWGIDLRLGLRAGGFGPPQSISFLVSGCAGSAAQCVMPTQQKTLQSGYYDFTSLKVGDFNHDGIPDFAFIDEPASGPLGPAVVVALAHVDSSHQVTFTATRYAAYTAGLPSRAVKYMDVADVDGDGNLDIAFCTDLYFDTANVLQPADIIILYGDAAGGFSRRASVGTGSGIVTSRGFKFTTDSRYYGALPLHLVDLNGDGRTDLIGPQFWEPTPGGVLLGSAVGGPPTSLTVSGPLSAVQAGVAQDFTVKLFDANNHPATYVGSVSFLSSDSGAKWSIYPIYPTPSCCGNFAAADNASKTFTNFTFATLGPQSLTASTTSMPVVTGAWNGNVVAGLPASISLALPSPSSGPINTVITTLHATVKDAWNHLVVNAPVQFTASPKTGNALGSFPNGGIAYTGANGVASIDVTANGHAGDFNVQASALGGALLSESRVLTVTAGPATHFSISGFSVPFPAGTPIVVTVTALDAANNVAEGYTGLVTITSSDPAFQTCGDYFSAGDKGVHSFYNRILKTLGQQSITVTDNAQPSITTTRSNITVVADPPAALERITGWAQQGLIGSMFGNPLVVAAKDAQGRTLAGQNVTFTVPANFGSLNGGHSTITVVTDDYGQAYATLTAGILIGGYKATATLGSFKAEFNESNIFPNYDGLPQVTAVAGALTFSRGQYASTITLTNTGAAQVDGPFIVALVALELGDGVGLVNASGSASGIPYLTVSSPLAPGASAKVTVLFTNPNNKTIKFLPGAYKARGFQN